MEVWHRVAINAATDVQFTKAIRRLRIEYKITPGPGPGQSGGLLYFDIRESDSRWEEVSALIERWGASNVYEVFHTPEEIMAAEWVRVVPVFQRGYPQPERDMLWEGATYEGVCPDCGAGYVQKAPFRFAGEPRLGKHDVLCLQWVYTLFCTPRVLAALEENRMRGIEVWPAMIHKADRASSLVSQLLFPHVAAPGLVEEDKLMTETCPRCGLAKYYSQVRGFMHFGRSSFDPSLDAVMTGEWFGSGGKSAYREFVVSNRFAALILESGWKGVRLKPIVLI